ncbi:MAG TPA: DUF445 family protein [Leptospiraceae bacterium]|nr:DUF445 family protein [Leptospiraceae bacterium]HNA08582.1 DUF445 family protein [Leptospiraceae bacterium]HNE08842.1 DUF445 family protein [Leptospiraceae bacterium]HNE53445.1 DUF445 family protein [Leptospiraceae bacterium]HNH02950.1 DUF445 family protein [Leptospiraceae bacterium]
MQWLNELVQTHPDLIKFISIPITCAFVGWITNYVAVKMIFHPAEFWGIGKLGWKGIIPNHAIKMSGLIAKILTERLVKPHELFLRVNPDEINHEIQDLIDLKAKEIIKDIIATENPVLWSLLSDDIKNSIEEEVRREIPKQIVDIYKSFGNELDNVLEFDEIIRSSLSGKKTSILIEMFQRCGGPEFRFIIVSGIYFGFLIGLIQLAFINILGQWWTMPIMGVVVGYYTNWIAIQMIFKPLEPKKFFFFFTYQGLFLKRQEVVSKEFANVVANNVLNQENIIRLIFTGKGGDLLIKLVIEKAYKLTHQKMMERAPLMPVLLGSEKIRQIKERIAEKLIWILPDVANRIQKYLNDRLQIEKTIAERLSVLPKAEFEELLHSVFKEDELTLIILGAILGGLVGLYQAYLVF